MHLIGNKKGTREINANELANKSFMELWDSYTSKKMECEDLQDKLRQQQEKLNKYELRNIAQCDRIAVLEAQLSEALDAEKDRRFE